MLKIGVLAMQGAFLEHIKTLKKIGVTAIEVKTPEQLDEIDGLIIPGGESTTIGKMLVRYEMLEPIRNMISRGFPVFGTCAGLIMLSREVEDGTDDQFILGGLDVVTRRNAYGRQVDSFEAPVKTPGLSEEPFMGVFIRAPKIVSTGKDVEIIATLDGEAVAIKERNIMGAAFHPELTDDDRFHRAFIKMIRKSKKDREINRQ